MRDDRKILDHAPSRFRHCLCLLILFCAIGAYNADAARSEPTSERPNSARRYLPESGWVLADLDGDRELDFAGGRPEGRTEEGYFYQVQLQLGSDAPAGSFTVFHNNALGLKITGVDIDGDDDIDLIISDRFSRQHIGIWLNDGKARFVKSPILFSPNSDADPAFVAVDLNWTGQPTEVRRRLPGDLAAAGYVQALPLKSSRSNQHPVEWVVHFEVDPVHQRAPPTPLAV